MTKWINLALQGGGAHGAFTWGVLERLLEDERIEVEAISGTSAGAMNAAIFAAGYSADGRAGARAALDRFWARISHIDRFSPVQRTLWQWLIGGYRLDHSLGLIAFEAVSKAFSPYQTNPFNYNPLRDVLNDLIDFDLIRHASRVKLLISATNVRTGRAHIFQNAEMSPDVLLASACLPHLFQAVEIDGEHYWDGGYMGNPAIYPLIYDCTCRDVVIVQINPMCRDEVPKTARDIQNRVNEISFNSSLMHEMRAIHFVTRLIRSGALDEEHYKMMHIHMIEAEDELNPLGASSKFNADETFLAALKDIGRRAAGDWLEANYERIGSESTLDLVPTYL